MKPLNQQERNSALLKYLLAFVICLVLFALVFYVGSNVSKKEMEVLKNKIQSLKLAWINKLKCLA